MSGPPKGGLGHDDPIFAEERTQPGSEELGMGERCKFSGQVQLMTTTIKGRAFRPGDELTTKHAPENSDGKRKKRGWDGIQWA